MQPIILWSIATGPNPWKVAIILEELGLPYTTNMQLMSNLKSKPYTDINPNGRVPAIQDPNTGITLWETGAIIQYLVETYDKENKLTFKEAPQKWQLLQWLSFQISGQGPYFGQAGCPRRSIPSISLHLSYSYPFLLTLNFYNHPDRAYMLRFIMFHPESIPSAIKRYVDEIERVVKVLDTHLATQSEPALVGGKTTFADLAFVMYNSQIVFIMDKAGEKWDDGKYPHYKKWNEGLLARPTVQKVMGEFYAEMAKVYGQG